MAKHCTCRNVCPLNNHGCLYIMQTIIRNTNNDAKLCCTLYFFEFIQGRHTFSLQVLPFQITIHKTGYNRLNLFITCFGYETLDILGSFSWLWLFHRNFGQKEGTTTIPECASRQSDRPFFSFSLPGYNKPTLHYQSNKIRLNLVQETRMRSKRLNSKMRF